MTTEAKQGSVNSALRPPPSAFHLHSFSAQVKIRYRSLAAEATINVLPGGRFHVCFDEPCHGVAPGQAAVFYAGDIEKAECEVRFPVESLGDNVMVVFVDIYGNEARELIPADRFRSERKNSGAKGMTRSRKKGIKN